MASREVYPNAPLRLVTAEFRFPLSPVLAGGDLLSALSNALGDALPIIEPVPQGLQMTLGAEVQPPKMTAGGFRLLSRDRTAAVTVVPSRLSIETTVYEHWETFRESIEVALRAIGEELQAIVGLDRVGLRYINEIRAPGRGASVERWMPYVSEDLLAVARLAGECEIKALQSALHLATGDNEELLLRCGALEGHVVDDSGPLHLPTQPEDGPFFLLDIDSFWTRLGVLEEFDTAAALAIADRIHEPVDELFERAITEQLRDKVLRRIP
jgi:uncharacterized protein (TIGR04255 family)